jgi:hypothetical protein
LATPNGLSNNMGGEAIATAGGSFILLSGGSLAPGATGTFTVIVTGKTLGIKTINTTAVTSNNGGNGGTAAARVTVGPVLSRSKAAGRYN